VAASSRTRVAVSVNDSAAGKTVGDEPAAGDESADARARDETEQTFEGLVYITPAIGVPSKMSWPCGQDSRPKPECHRRRDLRHEARGVGHRF
jgi:hypothetical protein